MFLSIITPTYNRAKYLKRVYDSLKKQNCFDFEWIVYDDGSSDNTKEVIEEFVGEHNDFSIRYYYHKNEGFTKTLYESIQLSRGEYFAVICSDDLMPENGIELYKSCSNFTNGNEYAGFFMLGADLKTKKVVGDVYPEDGMDCSYIDELLKFKMIGDKQRVYKKEVFNNYEFKVFENERYVPEAVFTLEISKDYKFKAFNKVGYYFEYLEDGITANSNKIYIENPNGMYCRYLLQSNMSGNLKSFVLSIIYGRNSKKTFKEMFDDTDFKFRLLFLYIYIVLFHFYIKRMGLLIYENK